MSSSCKCCNFSACFEQFTCITHTDLMSFTLSNICEQRHELMHMESLCNRLTFCYYQQYYYTLAHYPFQIVIDPACAWGVSVVIPYSHLPIIFVKKNAYMHMTWVFLLYIHPPLIKSVVKAPWINSQALMRCSYQVLVSSNNQTRY